MSRIFNFLLAACVVAFSAFGQTAFKAVTVNTNTGIFGAGALGSGVKLTLNSGVVSNSTAVNLTGSLTNVTANGITLTANGISAAVNLTAGDLQDLSSFGVFDATVPTRVRVLRDDSGYILGSGRWYSKATTDTRTPDGITIIQPIDVLSEASPGRWVLEGYEQ